MLVLGVSGSPRANGNTNILLNAALATAKDEGAEIKLYHLSSSISSGCRACDHCSNGNPCVIEDDISDIYRHFQRADAVILASPVYFENVTSWMKTFLDRGQFLWANSHPNTNPPKLGLFISVASRLNTDFACIEKTMRVYFLSMGVQQQISLVFPGFEDPGSIEDSPFVFSQVADATRDMVRKLL